MEFNQQNLILELEQHIVNKNEELEALLVTLRTMLILLRFWMSLILMKQPIFKVLDSDKTAEILLELG
jgi:hypothetical protein